MINKINWGIIGCGDVTELKSGPAFNKVPDSALVAVMRRNAEKAKDYARRHRVAKWYSDASQLIEDPEVNAIYVATPPSSHEEYSLAAFRAGKPVYVEKPMADSAASAERINLAAEETGLKLSVAHYRRAQPVFLRVKEIIEEGRIGDLLFAKLSLHKRLLGPDELADEKIAWRVNPAIAGGGLFHDLAPHQLDLACYFFGKPSRFNGLSANQAGIYGADDIVGGTILFESGVLFNGIWNFTLKETDEIDQFEITGTKGKISFAVFGDPAIELTIGKKTDLIKFDKLQHVQQPMIERVVNYFLGKGRNLCGGEDGVVVMKLIESFVKL